MYKAIFIQTADGHLGRVDITSLSDQTLMEILVDGLSEAEKQKFKDKNEIFADVCDWEGVECDDTESVTSVVKIARDGSISLEYMPPKLKNFQMYMAGLTGTLETSVLPKSLEDLQIGYNKFYGSVDFASLPGNLQILSMYSNKFAGSVMLKKLPLSLEKLVIDDNDFNGSLCLENLPPKIVYLNASSNAFTGDFVLQSVPNKQITISAVRNSFSATAVVAKHIYRLRLWESEVTSVVDEEGNTHSKEAQIVGRTICK